MFARSSKRALSSTRQTACLPRSAARISAGTSGESSLVRYTVCLIARTSGSATACSTKRSTEVANESYGWWTRMSPSRIAARTSASLVLVGLQPRLGDGRPRRVAQLGEARAADDLPEVLEVEQPVDLVDLALLDRRAPPSICSRIAALIPASTSTRTTSPKRRRRSSSSTARSEVVGLVGDLEVGVARDAEDAVVDDLHAREERVEVRGDHVLERDERRARPRRGDEAREHLLGHLDAREGLAAR